MKEQIKKYIRGNTKRGHEVIAELEKLGGKNILKLTGNEYDKIYYIERYKYSNANTIDFVSEKSFIGQLIVTHSDWEEIELPKYNYPKTYDECIGKLPINWDNKVEGYKCDLITTFQKLLICRDAYWKIAGDEMGLGKSWKPDWTNNKEGKFIICIVGNKIIKSCVVTTQYFFAFPTEEMRDAFKENFDPDLEICKELL